MNRIALLSGFMLLALSTACDRRDEVPGEPAAFPGMEVSTPPGAPAGTTPTRESGPTVMPDDTIGHPGQPGPDAEPGI
jgi:hypothetical protein